MNSKEYIIVQMKQRQKSSDSYLQHQDFHQISCWYEAQDRPIIHQQSKPSRNQIELSKMIQTYLKQFLLKCKIPNYPKQMQYLSQKFMKIKTALGNGKGNKEIAAVIVFSEYRDFIAWSISQYCKQNRIKVKSFNKKYKIYWKIFPKFRQQFMSSDRDVITTVKMEERAEEDNHHLFDREGSSELILFKSEKERFIIQSKEYLFLIFDQLFPKRYLQQRKNAIVDRLSVKVYNFHLQEQIKLQFTKDKMENYYIKLFAVLKSLNVRISLERYCQIIKKYAEIHLSKQSAKAVQKIYDYYEQSKISQKKSEIQRFEQDNSVSEQESLIEVNCIKIEDNKAQMLRIHFPIIDSENQFQYDYYFSDFFYF